MNDKKLNPKFWQKLSSKKPFITKGQLLLIAFFTVALLALTVTKNGFYLAQISNINKEVFSGDKFGLKEFNSRFGKGLPKTEEKAEEVKPVANTPLIRGQVLGDQVGVQSEPFEPKELKEPGEQEIVEEVNDGVRADNFFSLAASVVGGAISTAVNSLTK